MVREEPKLSRLEVVGAWLGVWTPPRDAVVPPVPWRRLGIGALVLAVVVGGVVALIAPRIDRAKTSRAASENRRAAVHAAQRRAALVKEQRPRFGHARGSRAAVIAGVEDAIGRDARARFDRAARRAVCTPIPGVDASAAKVAYECLSATADVVGGGPQSGARGQLAIPFRAVVDFPAGTYAFCKVNPPPGEQIVADPRKVLQVPAACRLPTA